MKGHERSTLAASNLYTPMVNVTRKDAESRDIKQYEPRLSPFSLIDRFFDDPLFDSWNTLMPGLLRNRSLSNTNTSFPKVDVSETDTEIKVVANIPGIDPQKIEVEVSDDYLSLAGKIEKEHKEERGKIYRYEREYGEFRRAFALPARVNKDRIVAKAKNGVLTITLPKSEDERKTKVRVETDT